MINIAGQHSEVVLFYPTQSLVLQIADWVRKNPQLSLRLVSSKTTVDLAAELESAGMVIIDATEESGRAVKVLEEATRRLGRLQLAVYAERVHRGLKSWVEMRGVPMLAGPMSQAEWTDFFHPAKQTRPAKPAAAKTVKFCATVSPLPATYIVEHLQAVAQRDLAGGQAGQSGPGAW